MINKILNNMFDTCVSNKNNKEAGRIPNDLFWKSTLIVTNAKIENDAQALLVLNAMCILNTYVKQNFNNHVIFPSDKTKYWFKDVGCAHLIKYINQSISKTMLFVYFNPHEKFNDNVIFFEMNDMQYSFHGINKKIIEYIPTSKFRKTVFNEIQNKRCIKTLFSQIWESSLLNDACTIANKPLKAFVNNKAKYIDANYKNMSNSQLKRQTNWGNFFEQYNKKLEQLQKYENKFELTNWEYFGPSGEPWQQVIYELYVKHINVPIRDTNLQNKCFLFNEEWIKQNPKSTANLIHMIYEHGGTFSFDVEKVNVFVDDPIVNDWDQDYVSKNLEYFSQKQHNDQAEIISFEQLFKQFNIDLKILIKMKYPSDDWFNNISHDEIESYNKKVQSIKSESAKERQLKSKERKNALSINQYLEIEPIEDSPFARLEKMWNRNS